MDYKYDIEDPDSHNDDSLKTPLIVSEDAPVPHGSHDSPIHRVHHDFSDGTLTTTDMTQQKHHIVRSDRSISYEEDIEAKKQGLLNIRAFFFLILWYIFSGFTLFLNKYILTTRHADPTLLALMQLIMTTTCGFIQMYLPLGMYKPVQRDGKPHSFWRNMIFVGCMRFTSVLLSLVSLKYVAVSFTETVKSSAPLFTVIMSRLMVGEYTGLWTLVSLVPIMSGLALCSAYELSFNFAGFISALGTNLCECCQNVYSKLLISGERFRYTPAELQFYTSVASVSIQVPTAYFLLNIPKVQATTTVGLVLLFVLNGICFHFQSITAYVLMDYISPVTFSVANTVKRAFLIWLSVIIFGNTVTILSGVGTITVTVGVLLYTKARQYDSLRRFASTQIIPPSQNISEISKIV